MSASEKLERYEDVDYEPHMGEALWHALPQIVAVVEAAENFDARFEERFINGMAAPLNAALAALEEALS